MLEAPHLMFPLLLLCTVQMPFFPPELPLESKAAPGAGSAWQLRAASEHFGLRGRSLERGGDSRGDNAALHSRERGSTPMGRAPDPNPPWQGGEKVGWGTRRKVEKQGEKKNKRRRSPRGRYGAKQQRAGDKGWGGAGGLFEIGGAITRSC